MNPRRVWRRLSLKARLLLLGVSGLLAGLLVGGVLLVGVLTQTIHRSAEDEAFATATGLAELVAEDALPDPLPVSGDDVRVQVIDAQGRVRAASLDSDRLVPFLYDGERPAVGERKSIYIPGARIGVDGPVQVVAVPTGTPDDPQTVLVAKSLADLVRGVQLLKHSLLIAYPLLVVVLALVAWRVLAAALRPVEALRTGAEAITGGARPGRLPVPESRDEIHRLAVTLNRMLARLESSRARQRAFVADAAHELRSPLANMRTQLEVAQRIGDPAEWPEVADDLLADVQRMSRLVDDLLLLAKADDPAAGVGAPVGPVELGALLATVGGRYPDPPVRVTAPEEPLWTEGDESALDRVVANLLDNAVRHARSTVAVTARADGRHQVVEIRDDGPGVPEEDRDRVFGRFTRLDDARARDAGGSGLGLSIVRELVQRHGGTVTLSDAGPGLRVEVRLPAAPAVREPEPDGPSEGPAGGGSAEGGGPQDAGGQRPVQTGSARPTVSVE